jgi:hypothetical protein
MTLTQLLKSPITSTRVLDAALALHTARTSVDDYMAFQNRCTIAMQNHDRISAATEWAVTENLEDNLVGPAMDHEVAVEQALVSLKVVSAAEVLDKAKAVALLVGRDDKTPAGVLRLEARAMITPETRAKTCEDIAIADFVNKLAA